jgi:ankyrin repeat protein/energy-coupling factor transporter ATP-binding protein EcfA2
MLGEMDRDLAQEQDYLDEAIETDFNTESGPTNLKDSLQNEKQGADLEERNSDFNILLPEGSGEEETRQKHEELLATEGEDVDLDLTIRRSSNVTSSVSEKQLFTSGRGEGRKGILLQESLSFGLMSAVKEQQTYDFDALAENDSMSQKNDYSDIMTKIICFQGKNVTVASLIGELIVPETQVLLDEFKMSLILERRPVIGCACGQNEGYYIARTLQRNTFLCSDILKHRTTRLPPVFAVSGMTQQELQETALLDENICHFDGGSGIENSRPRIILLKEATAARDFKDLCNRARNFKTIHWLAKQPDGLEWRGSKGNMDVVHQYIDFSKSKQIPSIGNLKGEAVIISGNPGEGKSTYLTHLQSEIKETSPETWVIRLNLNEHLDLIQKRDVTEALVIELLSSAAGLENSLSASLGKALLTYSLQITGNVVVLVDEIGFRESEKIHDLLNILKNMKITNLVLAAPCVSTAIENSLSTLAFTLKPLTTEELQLLMTKLWKESLQDDDDAWRKRFAAELVRLTGKHSVGGNSLTPLDIKILSHTFEKEYMSSLTNKVVNLPESFDKIQLYERYIEWEFEVYKNNNAGSEKVWDNYLTHITYSSMSFLFPEDSIEEILSLEESTRNTGNNFSLISRSLQEYVTAKWFAEHYQAHRSFIEDKYFEVELQTMWEMFERILAKESELHLSVLYRDIQRVKDLLSRGVDVNSLDKGGRTALHISALQGKYFDGKTNDQCVQIASLLIEHGADISLVDGILEWTALRYADKTECWKTVDRLMQEITADIKDIVCTKDKLRDRNVLQDLLTEAAVNGLTYVAAFILDTGVDINTPLHSTRYSHQQYGLVHIASENGHISLLEFLLQKGADANMRIWNNSTPLHLACKQGNKECVLALLKRSAHINQSNKKGDTALHEAVRSRNSDIVQILLSNKAEAEICNKDGDTPLHVACQLNNLTAVSHLLDANTYTNTRNKNGDSPLDCAVRGGHTTLVKYILKTTKASVMDGNMNGRTPVHLAAETGDVLMIDYLLQVMPKINVCTDGGDTPLHIASLQGNTDVVAFLLRTGADSNRANNHGNTALHLASVRGHIKTMKALLECNAEVNAANQGGNTPLHLACLQGQANATRCLISHNAYVDKKNREKNTPLHLAAIKGDIGVITSLIEAKCDVNLPDKHGDTILHHCAKNGKLNVVELLVHTGHCHLNARNSKGDTPLRTAASSGFTDILDCLARNGGDIDCKTEDGETPLHLAVRNEDVELVTKLCQLGADLNIRNSTGSTPLHKAVYRGNAIVIRKLVEHGADRSVKDLSGYTPLDLAVHLGSKKAVLRYL